jgi:hypothetical protein
MSSLEPLDRLALQALELGEAVLSLQRTLGPTMRHAEGLGSRLDAAAAAAAEAGRPELRSSLEELRDELGSWYRRAASAPQGLARLRSIVRWCASVAERQGVVEALRRASGPE